MCIVANSTDGYHVCAGRSESILASLSRAHHRISSFKRWRCVLPISNVLKLIAKLLYLLACNRYFLMIFDLISVVVFSQ